MKAIKLDTIRKSVNSGVILLYFLLSFLSLYEFQLTLINFVTVVLGVYLFLSNLTYIKNRHLTLFFIFIAFSIYSVLCLFLFQNKITYIPIRVFVHFSFFIAVIRYGVPSSVLKMLLYVYVIFILYLLFVQNIYINHIFPGTSKNIIGWFALGVCVLYYAMSTTSQKTNAKNQSLNIGPVLVTMLICLISLSRSNIICASLLLFGVLYSNFQNYSIAKKTLYIFLIFTCFSVLLYAYFDLLELSLQRFEERGLESADRALLLDSYFEKLNVSTFLLGVSSNQYPFTLLNENFHNSFLLGHSNFGVLFVFFLLYILFVLFKNIRFSFFLVILALVLLIRSLTDTIMFIGYFDFILFVILYKIKKTGDTFSTI